MLPVRAERIIKGIEADKLRERTRQGQRFGKWFGKCGSTQERVHKADGTASPARPPDEAGPWLGSRDLDLGRAPTTQTARGGLLYLNCASHVAYAKARLPLRSPARRYVLAQSTCPAPERIPRQGLLGASLGGLRFARTVTACRWGISVHPGGDHRGTTRGTWHLDSPELCPLLPFP